MPATDVVNTLTRPQYLQVVRERCENDFQFFVRYFFKHRKGSKFVFSDHHKIVCDDLMMIYHGIKQNYLCNMPPRYSKTELVVVMFVAWCFMKNPRCEFIHLSYADQLVMDNSDAIKGVMKSEQYRELWPEIVITTNRDSKRAWGIVDGGTFYATASGGSVTGFGAGRMDEVGDDGRFHFSGCILIDDPLKPDDARFDPLREGVNRRWQETFQSRRNNPETTPTILTMQRIHKKDFTNTLVEQLPPGKTLHRKLPALMDEGLSTERALWPAKHTVEALKAMRDSKNDRGQINPLAGETFSGQYQQEPTPAGGGLIHEDWWRWYADRQQVVDRCTFFFITADTAYTADQRNDPSALQLWGAEGRKRLYLLDKIRGFWEFPDLIKNTLDFWQQHTKSKRLYIEAKASGISLAQQINRAKRSNAALRGCKVVLWRPKAYEYPEDKVGRVKAASYTIHAGMVWLPDPDILPSVDEFVDEHNAFTENDTHAHDEEVDCQTMAVSIWTHHGGGKTK